jgi:hypothetical protein
MQSLEIPTLVRVIYILPSIAWKRKHDQAAMANATSPVPYPGRVKSMAHQEGAKKKPVSTKKEFCEKKIKNQIATGGRLSRNT